ncbi:DinB family protein [Pontibacter litorisediminis]|uniref:DinB family protein n=1 Tax=Pontibacter litorisediminis TaxID=1846260 RepID=UPI0023ED8F49|nr:DinB family protein [Pontibacter litorisediminis]
MNPKLEDKYLRLEELRNRLLDELAGLDDAQLNKAPAPEKWSINQHVAHLVLVEERALDNVRYKLQRQEELQDVGLAQEAKLLLVKVALHSGRKFVAPPVVVSVPEVCHLPELRQQWDKVRFELEDELTSFPQPLLEKGVFKHPMIGYLTIGQALNFLQDHFIHHKHIMQAHKQALVG